MDGLDREITCDSGTTMADTERLFAVVWTEDTLNVATDWSGD